MRMKDIVCALLTFLWLAAELFDSYSVRQVHRHKGKHVVLVNHTNAPIPAILEVGVTPWPPAHHLCLGCTAGYLYCFMYRYSLLIHSIKWKGSQNVFWMEIINWCMDLIAIIIQITIHNFINKYSIKILNLSFRDLTIDFWSIKFFDMVYLHMVYEKIKKLSLSGDRELTS